MRRADADAVDARAGEAPTVASVIPPDASSLTSGDVGVASLHSLGESLASDVIDENDVGSICDARSN